MNEHNYSMRERMDDLPPYLRYVLVAIKEVGFPILVALMSLGLLWKQMDVSSSKIVEAVNKNTDAVTALRHFLTHKYDNE